MRRALVVAAGTLLASIAAAPYAAAQNPPGPVVSSITPNSGPMAGGTTVTISGSGFRPWQANPATVTIGGNTAALVSAPDDKTLIVTTPASGVIGPRDVVVTNRSGFSTTVTNGFNYLGAPPALASVSPGQGLHTGGTVVTLSGSNFSPGATVTVGGNLATAVSVVSSSVVTCTTPPGTVGTVFVTLTNVDGQSASIAYAYELPVAISGISPTSGPVAGGNAVTITGSGFLSRSIVTFGSSAASVTSQTGTQLVVTAPAGSLGTVVVAVTNTGTSTASTTYTYTGPVTLTSIMPIGGPPAGGNVATITGTGFFSATTVTFGSSLASVLSQDLFQLQVAVPPGSLGAVTVTVTNPGGNSATTSYNYATLGACPTITAINPTNGPGSTSTSVTIAGTGFLSNTVVFFDAVPATVTSQSGTQLVVATPLRFGPAVVTVMNPDGQRATTLYTFNFAPFVSAVTPAGGLPAGGNLVTISGANFLTGATVSFGSASATITSLTGFQIRVTAPGGSGTVNVTVTNPDGQSSAKPYTYSASPTIAAISPTDGPAGGGNAVTITGSSFASGATVTFAGSTATVTSQSDTRLVVTAPTGTAGSATVVVTNPGSLTASTSYAYNAAPTISSISPSAGSSAGGTTVTVTGTGFFGTPLVRIGGFCTVLSSSATSIVALTPTGTGTQNVVVQLADLQTATLASGYTYDSSLGVSLVSPNDGSEAGGETVTLTGIGFTVSSTVRFGSNSASISSGTATQLVVTAPASSVVGPLLVTVADPSAGSASRLYTYHALSVSSVAPTRGSTLGGSTVTINGDGFAPGATVEFAGAPTTVNSLIRSRIVVTTPPGVAGNAVVRVTNTDGKQATGTFFYAAPPVITGIAPATGPVGGESLVTITGTGFEVSAFPGRSTEVNVDHSAVFATVVTRSTTQLVVLAPGIQVAGPVTFYARNFDGQEGGVTYTYFALPKLATVAPNTGPNTGGTAITLAGFDFASGATLRVGGVAATSVSVVSATQITAVTPNLSPAVGPVDIVVTNPSGHTAMLSRAFVATGNTPTIATVQPASGPLGGGTPLTISGAGFAPGAHVRINGRRALRTTVVNSGTITCLAPSSRVAGSVAVTATNPDGLAATAAGSYAYVVGAAITGITPAAGPATGGTTVTITGSGFANGATVAVSGSQAASVVVVSPTQLTAVTPTGATGLADVEVTNFGASPTTALGLYTFLAAGAPGIATTLGADPTFRNDEVVRFAVTVTDPEGHAVSMRLRSPPAGCVMTPLANQTSPATASVQWYLQAHQTGLYWLSFEARDNQAPPNVAVLRVPVLVTCARVPPFTRSDTMLFADVTGDGRDDLIGLASFADEGSQDNGAIYVWAGATSPAAAPTATLRAQGLLYSARLGDTNYAAPIQCADVTGDGVLDIVVRAAGGELFVFAGGASLAGTVGQTARLSVPGVTIRTTFGDAPVQPLLLADVSGDGIRDIVVAAPRANLDGVHEVGAVFLWYGGSGLAGDRAPDAEVLVPGIPADRRIGTDRGPGLYFVDLTGDGRRDIVVGAQYAPSPVPGSGGAIYVWDTASPLAGKVAPTATFYATTAGLDGRLGGATFGDLNDDGYLDCVASSMGAYGGVSQLGQHFVFAGGPGLLGPTAELAQLNVPLPATGLAPSGGFLRDVTGDGVLDLVTVSPSSDDGQIARAGIGWVWAGGLGLAGANTPTAILKVSGASAGDELGSAGLFCDDVTGDGVADVVLVSRSIAHSSAVTNAGGAYVWTGGPGLTGTPTRRASLRHSSATSFDWLGYSDGGSGTLLADVTGDGVNDVVIAATRYNSPTNDAGALVVWAGGSALSGTPTQLALLTPSAPSGAESIGAGGVGLGFFVADVTGDGTLDVLAASQFIDAGSTADVGGVLVWAGGSGLSGTPTETAVTSVSGAAAQDRLTISTGVGMHAVDVTGDGVLDLVASTYIAKASGISDAGAVYVWAGGSGFTGASTPNATLRQPSPAAQDKLGEARGEGVMFSDLDGDGVLDLFACSTAIDLVGKANVGAMFRWSGGSGLSGTPTTHHVPWAVAGDALGK